MGNKTKQKSRKMCLQQTKIYIQNHTKLGVESGQCFLLLFCACEYIGIPDYYSFFIGIS